MAFNATLAKKLNDVTAERDALRKQLEEKNNSGRESDAQLRQTLHELDLERSEKQRLKEELDELQVKARDTKMALERKDKEVEERSRQVRCLEDDTQQWRQKYELLITENETTTRRVTDLEKQASEREIDLQSQITTLQETLSEQHTRLQEYYDHMREQENTIESLRSKNESMRSHDEELKKACEQNKQLKMEIELSRKMLKEYEKQCETMLKDLERKEVKDDQRKPQCEKATPGSVEMAAAYTVSKQLVRERLARENPEDLAILDGLKDTDIICVRGTYDHIHLVLEAIHIPFAHVNQHDILHMDLRPDQTVYVNCPSSFPPKVARKLAKFVEGGGLLITTDWALHNVIEVGFPNTIKYSGTATGDEVVSVEIVDKEDDTLKGFIDQEKDAAPVWWLEGSSYPIEILDKRRVKVLVRSDDLKKRYKHDPVIVRFDWGKGTVYHMISHFYLQRSETCTKKQSATASDYASAQMVSEDTVTKFKQYEQTTPGLNYGMVQSAATSSEFVSRCVVKQKKKSYISN